MELKPIDGYSTIDTNIGNPIYAENGSMITPYSIGFWAKKGNNYGIVTAGHGTWVAGNGTTTGTRAFATTNPSQSYLGRCKVLKCSGNCDAAFIRVSGNSNYASSTIADSINITAPTSPTLNAPVTKHGAADGTSTGTIFATNVSVISDGVSLTGLAQCTYTSQGGDSGGGGVVSGTGLVGIHQSHATVGTTFYSFVVPYSNISSALGIVAITK